MPSNLKLNKNDIYKFLMELSKEYRKLSNKTPIQVVIVGGASVILNYGCRDNTIDIDAYYGISDCMKQAINNVSDALSLPISVLNDDFKYTESFSHKLITYSTYFKTFSNVMEVRTIKAQYLIAMKLVASRKIRHDRSDIISIIDAERKQGNSLTLDDIKQAVINLYGTWDKVEKSGKEFIENVLKNEDLSSIYNEQFHNEITLEDKAIEAFENKKIEPNMESLNAFLSDLEDKE